MNAHIYFLVILGTYFRLYITCVLDTSSMLLMFLGLRSGTNTQF
jgi:hypothetical protein